MNSVNTASPAGAAGLAGATDARGAVDTADAVGTKGTAGIASTMATRTFAVGSLVKARGREWVVLPESTPELLLLRPLGGSEAETAGVYVPLESVEPATFELPDPASSGDYRSCRLLRDAVRLSTRAGAGPFRCFSRIAVEPRPYQLVPLLMALGLEPVRLLIADDVGVGKTIEAGLIVRELWDRGEISRFAVLCPPPLAEQWQEELRSKFNLAAELVLPSTAGRLERDCGPGESLFDLNPFVIVSLDFIKSDRRREEFVRTAPAFIIVDEAHTCAFGYESRGGRHQRHQLLRALAQDERRHLVLLTATPHSGKEDAFRSLLALLKPGFANLPEDLSGPAHEAERRALAAHFVQRRRADIRTYLEAESVFPVRQEKETAYHLSSQYRQLLDRMLQYARESVADRAENPHRQRVRWWSALAMLRALSSSPAAAAATLRTRAAAADTASVEEADEVGQRLVLDLDSEAETSVTDVVPGSDPGEDAAGPDWQQLAPATAPGPVRRRLLQMAKTAQSLAGAADAKLARAVELVRELLAEDYHPILFCRFVATAAYVERELRQRLPAEVAVSAVTGELPPPEREARVVALAGSPRRVLVATDCLSEGINLQDYFDAVLHYDLSWNPTRHEQREGRIDRYGQRRPVVRVVTLYGADNPVDGIVLDVLLRKHKTIRNSLGISVPVPSDTQTVVEAILEGLLMRTPQKALPGQLHLPDLDAFIAPRQQELYGRWESAANREKRSRTVFAQESIKAGEVARELEAARSAAGGPKDVAAFTLAALQAYGASVTRLGGVGSAAGSSAPAVYELDLHGLEPPALRQALSRGDRIRVCFDLPAPDSAEYLSRSHPLVAALASYVLDSALDSQGQGVARRAGVIRTQAVQRRTTLLLLRYRFDIIAHRGPETRSQLAEETGLLAFAGPPEEPEWLSQEMAGRLPVAHPDANVLPEQARGLVERVVEAIDVLRPRLEAEARQRAAALLEAHQRVRRAAHVKSMSYEVEPKLPPDVLGIYVYLPVPKEVGQA